MATSVRAGDDRGLNYRPGRGYTDFSTLLTRGDGQQRIKSLQFKAPEGLSGMISHVPLCSEPQAAEGACPGASQIGHTIVTAGRGPRRWSCPSPGATRRDLPHGPLRRCAVRPLDRRAHHRGPVQPRRADRTRQDRVDPHTAQITVTTGEHRDHQRRPKRPALDLRRVDQAQFMFNPSNCDPASFSGTAAAPKARPRRSQSHSRWAPAEP